MHVLSTPPAFILSQDQTLNKLYLNGLSRSNQVIEVSFLNFKDNELTSSLSLLLPVSLKDSKILLVLRLFSSLFDLQGTSRSQSAELYHITPRSSCQVFSLSIQNFHPQLACRANSFILAHSQVLVNTFFRSFLLPLTRIQFSTPRRRFANIPKEYWIVNTFFQVFWAFFQCFSATTRCCFQFNL